MKPLTLQLPDDVYERAASRAVARGATLPGEIAELVKRYSEGLDHSSPGNGEPGQESLAHSGLLQELARVATDCGAPNWDGYGAMPVEPETLEAARRFLQVLPGTLPAPTVGAEPDGHLTLEWYRHPRWTLSISVGPRSELFYAALFDDNDVRGRESIGAEPSETILSLIRRAIA